MLFANIVDQVLHEIENSGDDLDDEALSVFIQQILDLGFETQRFGSAGQTLQRIVQTFSGDIVTVFSRLVIGSRNV